MQLLDTCPNSGLRARDAAPSPYILVHDACAENGRLPCSPTAPTAHPGPAKARQVFSDAGVAAWGA